MNSTLSALVLLSLGVSMSAQAGFISGNHTYITYSGQEKSVALQGLEWMPLTYTAGLSRNYIESGFTDHFGGKWSLGEWRYATRDETAKLLASLWGQTHYGFSNNNYAGALWFLRFFGGLAYDRGFGLNRIDYQFPFKSMEGRDYSSFFFGSERECGYESGHTCRGVC